MRFRPTILGQLLEAIKRRQFTAIVGRHDGDAYDKSFRSWGRAISDPIEALTVARRTATVDDVVVVTGSTFLVADVREWFVPSAVQ